MLQQYDLVLIGDYRLGVVAELLADGQAIVQTEGGARSYPADTLIRLEDTLKISEQMAETTPDNFNPFPPMSVQWAWWGETKRSGRNQPFVKFVGVDWSKVKDRAEMFVQHNTPVFDENRRNILFTGLDQLITDTPFPFPKRPTIVYLCGSTRFMDAFEEANFRETLAGRIVLTVGVNMKKLAFIALDDKETVKKNLDKLHRQKIDMADEILVLNVGGYIGESTRKEIEYAQAKGKKVRFLEPVN